MADGEVRTWGSSMQSWWYVAFWRAGETAAGKLVLVHVASAHPPLAFGDGDRSLPTRQVRY
jgi:hypothetical protein